MTTQNQRGKRKREPRRKKSPMLGMRKRNPPRVRNVRAEVTGVPRPTLRLAVLGGILIMASATYGFRELQTLWINAGGARTLAPLMAAIALAESSGNPSAENDTDNNGTQTSWGLWQISNGTHSWPGSADPLNPENNARYAVQ